MNKMHGIIFAYRPNSLLRELVTRRTSSSLPYAGRYRTIDFMLSNMVNAGVNDIGILMHEQYQSLLDHLGSGKAWDLSRKYGGLKLLPPYAYSSPTSGTGFRGKMEALSGAYTYLKSIRGDYIVLAEGDVVVNLDLRAVLDAHIQSGADITAVCTPSCQGESSRSVYFSLDDGGRVTDVAIRPSSPGSYESLEIYVLPRALLLELTDHCAAHGLFSFDADVLQAMRRQLDIRPYVFTGYSARLDSVTAYFSRSMELLDPVVRRELFVPERPIRTSDRSDPSTYYGPDACSVNSLVADGCVIEGSLENCILFRGVYVGPGARLRDCVVMTDSRIGAGTEMRCIIVDKNVVVQANRTLIGHERYPLTIEKESVV